MNYLAGLIVCALSGAAVYFGLWLCGMPARPIGYGGAALIFVALWRFVHVIGKGIKRNA